MSVKGYVVPGVAITVTDDFPRCLGFLPVFDNPETASKTLGKHMAPGDDIEEVILNERA
jgi:hypothetical protein